MFLLEHLTNLVFVWSYFFFSIEFITRKGADKSSSEYFGLPQIKMYPMNSQRAASYYANTSHSGFCWLTLSWGKTLCMVTIFIQKRLGVLCKLNTTIKLKWSHPGETSWSVNHCMATTQLMGKQHIFGNMVKPFSYQKYSGVFDLIEGRQDLLAFSSRIHPKIYKTKSITHTKLLLELTTWHRKETFSETFNREFSSCAKVCKIPKRVFFFLSWKKTLTKFYVHLLSQMPASNWNCCAILLVALI